ncbi:cytochrome P450 [Nocardia sp. BMG51109]|uniref:cytochrome P450 n=1 Tax=Nocardia sp. BMG51109 TaxID=1056816 RepID=UPI000463D838|nr:cytochrome P450 [Nocardia sp. BMG51109]
MSGSVGSVPLAYRRGGHQPYEPSPELLRLRDEEAPTRQTAPNGDPVWLVTRYAQVRRVLADRSFSVSKVPNTVLRPKATGRAFVASPARQPGSFLGADPPEHTRLRRMVSSAFTPRRMRTLQIRIEEIVADRIESLTASGPPADLVQSFTLPIPSEIICEMIGVPQSDRPEFRCRAQRMFDQTLDREALIDTFAPVWEYLTDLVARQRRHPDDTILGGLVRTHGAELTDPEVTGITNLLLAAGHDTTANTLALGALLLIQRPDALATIREDPDSIDGAVEEILRYLSVAQTGLIRTATEDTELGGQHIAEGDLVMLSLCTANRDHQIFPDPDTFDITRRIDDHVAFGHGTHRCLGAPLARTEMCVALPALARAFPGLRLTVDVEDLVFRPFATVFGLAALPVEW